MNRAQFRSKSVWISHRKFPSATDFFECYWVDFLEQDWSDRKKKSDSQKLDVSSYGFSRKLIDSQQSSRKASLKFFTGFGHFLSTVSKIQTRSHSRTHNIPKHFQVQKSGKENLQVQNSKKNQSIYKKSSNFHSKCTKIHEEIHFIPRKCSKFSPAAR